MKTETNFSGGIQGGISNGMPIVFRLAFKPPATIGKAQNTADFTGSSTVLEAKGRHDPCVVPRAIPIVETMAALVMADMCLMQEARVSSAARLPAEVSPYFCDPSMNGDVSYNGNFCGWPNLSGESRKLTVGTDEAKERAGGEAEAAEPAAGRGGQNELDKHEKQMLEKSRGMEWGGARGRGCRRNFKAALVAPAAVAAPAVSSFPAASCPHSS
eukprot:571532-Hanusia_phi.AAC.9